MNIAARPSILNQALALAERHGFLVFPCNGKVPAIGGSGGFKHATRDPGIIRHWWGHGRRPNIGVRTGAASNLWVLDVDGQEGEASIAALESHFEPLPATVEVITGSGGRHVYFRHAEGLRNTVKRLGPGLDSRGEGGYVIAPPSVHPETGCEYAWSVDGHVDETPIANAPAWLIEALRDRNQRGGAPAEEWRGLVKNGASEGGRNNAVARLAGHLLRRYVDPYVVLELLLAWNRARCTPPLPDDEVVRTVDSIARREADRELARRRGAA